tara:strand:- start:19238 stop:19471 length:234 start_codon:yes stop_codon:yes gene_type:complete
MVNNYEIIKRLEEESFGLDLFRRGMLSIKLLDYKVYYERYILERKSHRKGLAITYTADEFNVSENTIRNAIDFMLKD